MVIRGMKTNKIFTWIKNNDDFIFISFFVNSLHILYYHLLGNFTADRAIVHDFNPISLLWNATYNYYAPVLNGLFIASLQPLVFGIPFFFILRVLFVTLFIYAYLNLVKNLNVSKKIAFLSCLIIASLPDLYIISQFWVYEIFFFFFVLFTVSAFSSFVKKESMWSLFLFFASLCVLGSFRPFYGLVFFTISLIFIFYFYSIKLHGRKILIAALIPFLIILFAPVKNYIYYGVFSANTTYDGLPLSTFFEFGLDRNARINAVESGQLPEIVLCVPGPKLGDYPVFANGKKYTTEICHNEIIPMLAKNFIAEKKISKKVLEKTGSMNDIAYWNELKKADIQVLKYYPGTYWNAYREGLRVYFKPTFPYILPYLSKFRDLHQSPESYKKVKWLFVLSDISLHPHVSFSDYPGISSYYRMILYPFIIISLFISIFIQANHRKIYTRYFVTLLLVVMVDFIFFRRAWVNVPMEYRMMTHLLKFNLIWMIALIYIWMKDKKNGMRNVFNQEKIILSYILLMIVYTTAAILLGSAVDQNKNRQPLDVLYCAAFVYVVNKKIHSKSRCLDRII